MEDSYRPETPPGSCTNELTRLNSSASSLTFANSNDTLLPSGNATTDKNIGWTNEKHNTFLDCLEASFVKQLHSFMASHDESCSDLSEKLSAHVNKASEQFPALHDVSWKKMITLRKPPVVDSAPDSHDCPKILHSDGQHHILDIQFCCKLHSKEKRRKDKRSSSCGHGTRSHLILSESAGLRKKVCRLTEGSGQNFVDEDFEENSSCKKMKTALVDTTDQEQIVPTRYLGVQELLVPCPREITN
ncbi:cold-regulated protein 28 [Nicotiana sylvestris]|uniref:Uncharacterized protein LOC104237588 n=1 Tax=Nicotiana sylvestris TaxID=4096 RepID=A0A1U7XUA3_NICSY|nr:PREDICTED: uncharacterized protein LOC104237588 [Nicotiana sylvestris]